MRTTTMVWHHPPTHPPLTIHPPTHAPIKSPTHPPVRQEREQALPPDPPTHPPTQTTHPHIQASFLSSSSP